MNTNAKQNLNHYTPTPQNHSINDYLMKQYEWITTWNEKYLQIKKKIETTKIYI